MASAGELRDGGAVVRSIAPAVERPCARPGCGAPARATLTFRYATREAWLERLAEEQRPQAYDLCGTHAARTGAPHGWDLRDRRPEDERLPDGPRPTPADLGGDRTVAVLAAALRAVPDTVSEDAVADDASEVGRAVGATGTPATTGEVTVEGIAVFEAPLSPGSPPSRGPATPLTLLVEDGRQASFEPDADVRAPAPAATTGGPRPPLAARESDRESGRGEPGGASDRGSPAPSWPTTAEW